MSKTSTDFFTFALVPSSISFGFGAIVLAELKHAQICPIKLAVAPDSVRVAIEVKLLLGALK